MITAADVRSWIVSSSGATVPDLSAADEAILERVIGAVVVHIGQGHSVPTPMTDDVELAVIMQAARLWERRNTPNGIGGFGEFGAVRVSRLDPDVAELLAPYKVWAFS